MRITYLLISLLLLTTNGCSSESLKRNTYEAIYHKECLDRTQTPNCDPEHPSYNSYQQQRKEEIAPAQP